MAETKITVSLNSAEFKAKTDAIKKSTADIEASLSGIATKAGAAFAGFSAGIAGVVNEAAKVETITTQFEVLTGSVDQAKKTVQDLQEFSAKTPFQFEGIAKAGAQLVSFGFEAEKLPAKLQKIGDVAAASGSSLNEVSLIFGQVAAAGKLTGERLLQFQERAIPIGPALAETMGVAEESIKDLVSRGEVDFATFEKAFDSLSEKGGAAFGGMQKQSQTLEGTISTLKDNFSLVAQAVGAEFLPTVKEAAQGITSFLQAIQKNPALVNLIANFLKIGAVITGVVTGLAVASLAFIKFRNALLITSAAMKAFGLATTTALGPIGLLVAAVIGLTAVIVANFEEIEIVFHAFAENIGQLFSGLGELLIGVFTFDADRIQEGFETASEAVNSGIDEAMENIKAKNEEVRGENERGLNPIEDALSPDPTKVGEQFEMAKNEADFQAKELLKLQREQEAAQKEIDADKEKQRQDTNKKFLKDQIKFGKEFATINKALNSEELAGAKQASNELVALQNSENIVLKSIGKAAAVTSIGIKTAESAMNVYSGFVAAIPYPPVGIALGVAGAAAAVAFGAEQIARVVTANRGGVVPGGGPNRDSVMTALTPGELVVPRQNFDEVISAVGAARNTAGGTTDEEADSRGTGNQAGVMIEFESEEASRVITAQEVEDSNLGISRQEALG